MPGRDFGLKDSTVNDKVGGPLLNRFEDISKIRNREDEKF